MPEPSLANSVTELAAATGRSGSSVRRWVARDDWPFGADPPWPLDEVRAWTGRLRPDPGAATKARLAEIRRAESAAQPAPDAGQPSRARLTATGVAKLEKTLEETRKLRLANDVAEGRLHDTEACETRHLRMIHAIKSGLLALGRSIAADVADMTDRREIESAIVERVSGLLRSFAEGGDGTDIFGPEAPPRKKRRKHAAPRAGRKRPAKPKAREKAAPKKPARKKAARKKTTRKRATRKK